MTERDFELLDLLCQEIEERGVDIAPTYSDWVTVTYGLATDFGEEGREAFHRICRQYADGYSQEANDKMYTYALAHNRMKVHFGSILLLARRAGVDTEALRGRLGGGRGAEVRRATQAAGATGRGAAGQSGEQTAAPVGPGAAGPGEPGAAGPVGPAAAAAQSAEIHKSTNPPYGPSHAHARGSGRIGTVTGTYAPATDEAGEDALVVGSEPSRPLPTLYDGAYAWPRALAMAVEVTDNPVYRDVLLLGSLTAMGATLDRSATTSYSDRPQYANLQTFVVAPSASGKGILAFVRHIVDPLHTEMRQAYERERATYEREKATWDALGRKRGEVDPPKEPPLKLFFIPGNITGTGMLQLLIDNGGRGFIFEVEADTVSTAIRGDYGQWSDALRKCFENEGVNYFRRTGQEYRECKNTFLSVLLSGTPGQVAPLIPSAENGLFSRQLFYYMPGVKEFISQFDANDRDLARHFRRLGSQFCRWQKLVKASGQYTLKLTDEQQAAFNERFQELFSRSVRVDDTEMNSSVVRLAINSLRMLLIVALLRATEPTFRYIESAGEAPKRLLYEPTLLEPTGATNQENRTTHVVPSYRLFATDDDLHQVLNMASALFEHALHVLSLLERTTLTRRTISDRDALFADLPATFALADARSLGAERGLNEKRVDRWVYLWRDKGLIQATRERGVFEKC